MSNLVRDSVTGRYLKTRLVNWIPETWDDGFVDPKGYFRVYRPDHPRASAAGWVHRYQVVYWLETGVLPPEGYDIHHDNEVKLDDRFENLVLIEHGDHTVHHSLKATVTCICVICKGYFELPQWRINEGRGKYCSQACYQASPRSKETRLKMSKSLRGLS